MQLLKDATKVMLAIPTNQGNVAAISFAVAADGTLSQIDETPDSSNILRSNSRDLLLPLNTLDEIKGIGDSTPPPHGKIAGITRGEEDAVQIISPEASTLTTGDAIKITGTQCYNGHYIATNIDGDSFEVEASYVNGDIGEWEVVPEKETGLIFDGAITAFERVTNNKLKITSVNHGLEEGDEVQIIDTTDYNRTCGIEKIDESNFAISGISWKSGEAVNLKLESRKRRGVMFNGSDEYIAISKLELTPPSSEFAFGYTFSAWVYVLTTSGADLGQLAALKTQKEQTIETASEDLATITALKEEKEETIATISGDITEIDTEGKQKSLEIIELLEGERPDQPRDNREIELGILQGERPDQPRDNREIELGILQGERLDQPRDNRETELGTLQDELETIDQRRRNKETERGTLQDELETIDQRKRNKETELGTLQDELETIEKQQEAIRNQRSIIVGDKEQCFKLLISGSTVSLKVKFAHGSEQVTDTTAITTGQWVHYAGVIASDGTSEKTSLTLCKNGRQVGTTKEVTALPDTPKDWKPELEIGKTFTGKIADVKIWDNARTAKEIKDSMYLQLTGREVDLEGYWRLGAITEEKERKVVDFSVNGNDGIVYGDAFVSSITLNRTLGDGTTQVVKYTNDDLIAVTARATYVETFEFKTDANLDPNNVDANNTKLFSFSYWGKKSRSSQDKITFSGETSDFESLGNNWYKATCRLTIPDGVAMMRIFELGDVVGTWSTLEICKHHVQLLSDSITEVKYTDILSLSTLADQYPSLPEKLNTLEQKEREEAKLLQEKRKLEYNLALLASGDLSAKVAAQQAKVSQLLATKNQKYGDYQTEVNKPFNYFCEIKLPGNQMPTNDGKYYLNVNSGSDHVYRWSWGQKWQFIDQGNGSYLVKLTDDQMPTNDGKHYLNVNSGSDQVYRWSWGQNWQFIDQGNGSYLVRLTDDQMPTNDGKYCLNVNGGSDQVYRWSWGQKWTLIKHEISTNKISLANTAYNSAENEYQLENNELTRLKDADDADGAQKTDWENRLADVNTELTKSQDGNTITLTTAQNKEITIGVQAALNDANNIVINTVSTTQQTAQALSTLNIVSSGSQTGLVTKGALLGFTSPASRIKAIETCEGNVQLSYLDNQGRMRLTNYDATSDSNNTTFEQWLPDELPVALNFADNGDKIELTNPVYIGHKSTIEAWFSYPLPEKNWNVLTSSVDDNSQPIVVYRGKWLGTRINGLFHNSGYNLETLSNGWYHLAVVASDSKATTTFYIDGKKVGEVESLTALEFDGTNDYVEVPAHTNPTTAITVSLWAKSNTDNWNDTGCLASKRDAYILHPIAGSKTIKFYIYASVWINVEYTPSDIKQWHHYAGTFDGQTLKLYIDGVKVASNDAFTITTAINSDSGSLFIGNDDGQNGPFNGQISDVRVWSTARTQDQIQTNMGKTLEGDESDLVGYWRLSANSAEDLSSSGKDGTFLGEPNAITLSDKNISNIKTIGNTKIGSQQFGKLAEVRVWNLALTEAEIAVNSKTRLSGNEPGLSAYYRLNEATGTVVRDVTGSGNNGTVAGATWWGCTAPVSNLGHRVIEFDGVDDYVELPAMNIDFSEGFTVETWVYYDSFKHWSRIIDFANGPSTDNIILANQGTSSTLNLSVYQGGSPRTIELVNALETGKWIHVAATIDSTGTARLFKDGQEIKQGAVHLPNNVNRTSNYIAKSHWSNDGGGSDGYFDGKLAEFRIWNKARTIEEIKADMHQCLTGKESGLVAYLPLDNIQPEGNTQKVLDLSDNNNHGTVHGAIVKDSNTLPIGGDALVSAEYSTVGIDPVTQKKSAIMRRFLASPALNGMELLPDKRIEELELKWIGNAQFKPTLLGYMEGAPPIPTENLTVQDDYNGATSVELTMSEDVDFSWNRSQEAGLGAAFDLFIGADTESHLGFGGGTKVADVRAGFKGNLDFSYNFLNETSISSSSSLTMSDRLELRGTQEPDLKFPHLGKRFIPKNVGYALVVSGLADVFITRLKRSRRMIGYQVQPVDGIPPDVNTITFLINPAYTMSGSLDGLTGSSATSDRFYRHVPEMRAQYGSLYPASYYRLQEAYDLKQKIEKEDKRRETYFAQFNARLLDEASLELETNSGEDVGDISLEREVDQPDENMTDQQKKAQEDAKQKQREEEARAGAKKNKDATEKKKAEINSRIRDQDSRAHATTSFAGWQNKMENIQIKAGKRNIVNNYVWDADGGLRTEVQSFANTAEHTIGGSFSLNAGLGLEANFGFFGAAVELTAQATINMTQTMSKTESRSKGFELNADLSGVECIGITDYNDYPLQPGEKVDRYRFMSFYLEGSTKNFNDFFDYVVDPEWLASNDEEARALRQAKGKANKTWRVLHRVTYVERPALMGFGLDTRKAQADDEVTEEIVNYFDSLEQKNKVLQDELQDIRGSLVELKLLLQNQQVSSNGGDTSSSQTETST